MDMDKASREQSANIMGRFLSSLEAAEAAIWEWDVRQDRLVWSGTTPAQFGLSSAEGVPSFRQWLQRCVHPEDRDHIADYLRRAIEGTATTLRIEYRIIPSEQRRWFAMRGRIERGADGEALRMHGLNIDITEHKHTEEKLRESEARDRLTQSEASLRDREERLRYALSAASAGTWIWDIHSGKADWSAEDYALYGRDPEDGPITYDFWLSCLHPDDRENATLAVKQALAGEVPEYRAEFRIIAKNGSVRWLLAAGRVERSEDGSPVRMSGINLDITERKKAEEALRQSEQRLHFVAECAGVGYWHWDIEEDHLEWTPICKRLFGIPLQEEISYARFLEAVHPDDRERADKAVRDCLESGGEKAYDIEYRTLWPDGTLRWIQAKGSAVFGQGRPLRMAGIALDITERKRTEAELARTTQILNAISRNSPDLIFAKDRESRLVYASHSVGVLLGEPIEELFGKNDFDFLHDPKLAAAIIANDRKVEETRATLIAEEPTRLRDGSVRTFLSTKIPWLAEDGTLLGTLGVSVDITERKRQEEHINLLMREVNHRSKNILTLVQAIARQTATAQPADFLRRFDERVSALAASQDLLVKNEWKGADLEQLIRSQLAYFKDLLDTRITLSGPPLTVTAAAAQALGMALHELATNAGKYGALSNAHGRVCVCWDLEVGSSEDIFVMSWRENGGPPVRAPEQRGFGWTVICRMAEESLDAAVELRYDEEGLNWLLRGPAREVAER